MVIHLCELCKKVFNKKSTYINHIKNKKKPCKIIEQEKIEYNKNSSKIPQNSSNVPQKSSKSLNHICYYCGYDTERKDNYYRHLSSCKVKKRDIEEKEEILNKLLEQNNLLASSLDQQKEQNTKLTLTIEELNKRIDKLENDKKSNNTQNNRNIKNQYNGNVNNNNTINIVGFGKEDLKKIENKDFFESLTQMGYKIPAKMVEKIHINNKYPEYKNIYISDINRGKAMVHDGNKWKLDKYDNISDKLLDKILNFMEERYEELKDNKNLTDKRKTNIENKLKIIQIMRDYEEEEEKERHEYYNSTSV